MLVGYVSDEHHYVLADVLLEFERGSQSLAVVRPTPRGAVYAELEAGEYLATLTRDGYGAKRVEMRVDPERPHRFRLLSDSLLGYMWPKWVRSGERGEYRVHSAEGCQVSLWRYGLRKEFVRLVNWHGEHSPRAGVQITPDGDYAQTGAQWNLHGYASRTHSQRIEAPERSGLYYLHLKAKSGAFFAFPWVVAPETPAASVAVPASTNTWNAYNNFGGRSNYINPNDLPADPASNIRQENDRYLKGEIEHFFRFEDHEYRPLSFDRPEPFNHVPKAEQVTDPIADRNESHLAPAEWRLAGLARARRVRLRPVRRLPAAQRQAGAGRLQSTDPQYPPRILVAGDVLAPEGVGLRARRAAHVPGRQRHLRGGGVPR